MQKKSTDFVECIDYFIIFVVGNQGFIKVFIYYVQTQPAVFCGSSATEVESSGHWSRSLTSGIKVGLNLIHSFNLNL